METTIKTFINIALILIIVVTGIFIHKAGKPYNAGLFAIHKLTTAGFIYFIIRIMLSIKYFESLNLFDELLLGFCVLSILGLLISGGLMSLNKSNESMLTTHIVSASLFVVSISGVFYQVIMINRS